MYGVSPALLRIPYMIISLYWFQKIKKHADGKIILKTSKHQSTNQWATSRCFFLLAPITPRIKTDNKQLFSILRGLSIIEAADFFSLGHADEASVSQHIIVIWGLDTTEMCMQVIHRGNIPVAACLPSAVTCRSIYSKK